MKMIQMKNYTDTSKAVQCHCQLCLQHNVVQLKLSVVSYCHEETNYSIQLCSFSKPFPLSQYERKHAGHQLNTFHSFCANNCSAFSI